jgi:hypothetical protein
VAATIVSAAEAPWDGPGSSPARCRFAKPAGLADNDVIVAVLVCQDANRTFDNVPAAGWVEVINTLTGLGRTGMWYLPVTDESGEPLEYTFDLDDAPAAGNEYYGHSALVRGADLDAPLGSVRWQDNAADTSQPSPDIAPDIIDGLLACHFWAAGVPAFAPPSGMTEVDEDTQDLAVGGTGLGVCLDTLVLEAEGQVGAKTVSQTGDGQVAGLAIAYVVRPSSPVDIPVRVRDVARTDGASASLDLVATMPTSKPGDLLYAALMLGGGIASNHVVTAPAGWDLLAALTGTEFGESPGKISIAIYTRIAGVDEPASYTWGLFVSETTAAVVVAFDGAAGVDVEGGTQTIIEGTTDHAVPVRTPTTRHTLLCCAFATESTGAHTLDSMLEPLSAAAGTDYYFTVATVPRADLSQTDAYQVTTAGALVSARHVAALAARLPVPLREEVYA